MARLVHTADVHLHPDAPERRDALAAVLERAEALDADAVTIGGDCFEDEVAAERLRPELRSLFADRPFPVVLIPGNHDRDAFEGDAFFGPAVRPATAEPFEQLALAAADIRLTAVPYTPTLSDDRLVALRDREPFDGLDCLLVHCSLEAPGATAEAGAGEEDATRYAPVTRSELAALEFDVVLAGHYHGANRVALPNDDGPDGTFVYPGTPASVTRSETGPRSFAVVDDDATPIVQLDRLDAFHYDELSITVRPGGADDALATVSEHVERWDDREVDARIDVGGFVDRDETEFAAEVAEASGDVPHDNEVRSATPLLQHPIYREFDARLDAETALEAAEHDEYDPERLCEDARERVLAAMADLAADGELT
jgi:exonuclease SbcD